MHQHLYCLPVCAPNYHVTPLPNSCCQAHKVFMLGRPLMPLLLPLPLLHPRTLTYECHAAITILLHIKALTSTSLPCKQDRKQRTAARCTAR